MECLTIRCHFIAETCLYDEKKQEEMFDSDEPEDRPIDGGKVEELNTYCQDVRIILQTVNDNEYQAAVTMMKPPSDNFTNSVIFPMTTMVVD